MPLRFSHTMMIAGLLSISTGALAQPAIPPQRGGMEEGAMPMRGAASRAELKTMLEAAFDRRDANHDGKLDAQDPKARDDARRAALFDRIDADKNGAISKQEFAAAAESRRDAPPLDGPMAGRMGAGRAMMFRHGGPVGAMRGPLPFHPMPGAFMRGGPDAPQGEPITKSAFVERGLARFDKADTDHDGKISPAEREAARGSMRDRRGRMTPPLPNTPQSGQ